MNWENAKTYWSENVRRKVEDRLANLGLSIYDVFRKQPSEEPTNEYVYLEPLPLNADLLDSSKVKLSKDNLVATRVSEDYNRAFVTLSNNLQPHEFIGVQILKIDEQLVGGIKLYSEDLENGRRRPVYGDTNPKSKNLLIFWISCERTLFCLRDGHMSVLDQMEDSCKLICDIYGSVTQISACFGRFKRRARAEKASEAEENPSNSSPDLPESNLNDKPEEIASSSSCDAINRTETPHLTLSVLHGQILQVKLTLPQGGTTDTCSNTAARNNSESAAPGPNENNSAEKEECKICMDAEANVVLIPCGHMCFCYECSGRMATRYSTACPICRQDIRTWHKVHSEKALCENCAAVPPDVVLLPCGDMCLCESCARGQRRCPICRLDIKSCQQVFHS